MSFAYNGNGNGEILSDDDFSGDEGENEEEELGIDRKHDAEKCYQNYLEVEPVAPDSRPANTLSSRAAIEHNDMDEYDDYDDTYQELNEDEIVTMARHPPTMSSSAHGSASASASASVAASVFRRTSSSSATSSFASEDDEYPSNNNNNSNRNTGRRQSNGLAPSVSGGGGGRVVSVVGVRRQSATSGVGVGGGVIIEDGLNTAKIVNIKSNLRPVASKIFDTVNNREDNNVAVVGGSTGWPRSSVLAAAGPRPINGGSRGKGAPVGCAKSVGAAEITTPQKKRPMVKTAVAVESTSDVGTGQNSIRMKAQKARLRPVLSRIDCDDNIDDQEPPVRDVQKILPIGPAAKKTSSASSVNAHRWNQQIPNPPSPPPPPFPSPPPSSPHSPPPSPPAFPLPSPLTPKKTPTFGPMCTKTPTFGPTKTPSSFQRTQPWHQPTNSPSSPPVTSPVPSSPSSRSPFPDPHPVSNGNGRREPSHTPRQTGQKQDQPWGRTPWSNDPSEMPAVKRNADRTQSQQPMQATKVSHASASTHPAFGRSGSVNPSSNGYDNSDTHGRVNERMNGGGASWQDRQSLLTNQNYYFGDLERDQCERKLDKLINEDGSYVVRNSRSGGADSPYSLSIVYKRHIYHLNIRLRPDGKFSIGKAKSDEKMFNSVAEMIAFHQNNAIELIGDNLKRTPSGKVTLKKCPTKF